MPETIVVERERGVARVRLNRPDVRNALNEKMIGELATAFAAFGDDASLRAVVLEGEGKLFSGGADVAYMRAGLDLDEEANYADALRLADMFSAIENCPLPVVAKVHGAALGGGCGLVAACDLAISADDVVFGFTEVRLGIVPAVISPFVLRKIGQSHARALFVTGERFDAERALRIGLVHEAVSYDALQSTLDKTVAGILACGPQAVRVAKHIARTVSQKAPAEARTWTARTTAERRASPEGQEGLRAFLEKRKPAWQ